MLSDRKKTNARLPQSQEHYLVIGYISMENSGVLTLANPGIHLRREQTVICYKRVSVILMCDMVYGPHLSQRVSFSFMETLLTVTHSITCILF